MPIAFFLHWQLATNNWQLISFSQTTIVHHGHVTFSGKNPAKAIGFLDEPHGPGKQKCPFMQGHM